MTARPPVVDLAPTRCARSPSSATRSSGCCAPGGSCSVRRPRRSRPSSPRSAAGAHAVAVASGTEALRLALVALGVGHRRRGGRARRSRPSRPQRRCARRARSPVFVDVDRRHRDARRRSTPLRAVTDRTRAVIPVHLYGRPAAAARPRRAGARGRRPGARRARPADCVGGGGVQLLPDEEPRRDRRRRRGGHRRRRSRRADAAAAGTRPHRRLRAHRGDGQLAAVGDRGGRAAASSCAACPNGTGAGSDRTARTARRRRSCAGRRRTSGTCTTCAWRGSTTATRSGRGMPFGTAVHYPRRSPSSPRTAVRAGPVPGGRGMGGGVRIAALLPRDDRRRDRGRVPRPPVNPAVESISAFFPCYNDEATIGADGRGRRLDDRPGRRRRRGHRHQRRLDRRLAERAQAARPRPSRGCASSPTSTTAATAARCSRGSAPATKQWVFYTDGDGQFDPTELELLVDAGRGRRRRRAGLQAQPGRQRRSACHRPRVPPVRVVRVRPARSATPTATSA